MPNEGGRRRLIARKAAGKDVVEYHVVLDQLRRAVDQPIGQRAERDGVSDLALRSLGGEEPDLDLPGFTRAPVALLKRSEPRPSHPSDLATALAYDQRHLDQAAIRVTDAIRGIPDQLVSSSVR